MIKGGAQRSRGLRGGFRKRPQLATKGGGGVKILRKTTTWYMDAPLRKIEVIYAIYNLRNTTKFIIHVMAQITIKSS